MINPQVARNVLNARVGEHLLAFRQLSTATDDTIMAARLAMRTRIGELQKQYDLDDCDIMCMILEEFTEFACFAGTEIVADNARAGVVIGDAGRA